jgi:hypothetical protein
LKGGLVIMDADGRAVLRTVAFQYNPDSLSRTLTPRIAQIDTGDRLEGLRLRGAPIETMKLDIELDATDRLESPDRNPDTVNFGLLGDLATLETIISPLSADLIAAEQLASAGSLEILPLPSPLVLLTLGPNRVAPIRITEFTILEEAFDARLNPIHVKISLGVRVLNNDDVAYGTRAAALFFNALQAKERFTQRRPGALGDVGLTAIP